MPSISMKPLVPLSPGPPNEPKSFWAPWPAIREPCTKRTIVGAVSFTLEVSTLTPFDVFVGAGLIRRGREHSSTLYTRECLVYTLALASSSARGVLHGRHLAGGLVLVYAARGGAFCGGEGNERPVDATRRSRAHRRATERDAQGGAAHPHRGLSGARDDVRAGCPQRGAAPVRLRAGGARGL